MDVCVLGQRGVVQKKEETQRGCIARTTVRLDRDRGGESELTRRFHNGTLGRRQVFLEKSGRGRRGRDQVTASVLDVGLGWWWEEKHAFESQS